MDQSPSRAVAPQSPHTFRPISASHSIPTIRRKDRFIYRGAAQFLPNPTATKIVRIQKSRPRHLPSCAVKSRLWQQTCNLNLHRSKPPLQRARHPQTDQRPGASTGDQRKRETCEGIGHAAPRSCSAAASEGPASNAEYAFVTLPQARKEGMNSPLFHRPHVVSAMLARRQSSATEKPRSASAASISGMSLG